MHTEDGDTMAARMEAFADLAAPPGERDGDGDGGQAADGHRATGQAVNRHGVALR